MKKVLLTALVLLPLTVSCGKNEIIGKAQKEVLDGMTVTSKALFDFHDETGKFLTDAKRVVDKGLTDAKNTGDIALTDVKEFSDTTLTDTKQGLESQGSSFIEDVGGLGESLGQIPRNTINGLLGTDSSSNEDIADLEDRVDALEAEMHNSFYDLSEEIQSLAVELRQADSNLASSINAAIQKAENELAVEINRTTRNSRRINRALSRIRGVKRDVRRISRDLYNLEIVCENITGFIWIDVTPVCEVQ